MDFDLKDVLDAIGPTASLIFAAWIFLSFLQQRYIAAYERYRALIGDYRDGRLSDQRKHNVGDQIELYKRRCQQMRLATNLGIVAAILFLVTLVAGALNVMFPDASFLKYIGGATALLGLLTVIAAAIPVILENVSLQGALESELADLPDLANRARQESSA